MAWRRKDRWKIWLPIFHQNFVRKGFSNSQRGKFQLKCSKNSGGSVKLHQANKCMETKQLSASVSAWLSTQMGQPKRQQAQEGLRGPNVLKTLTKQITLKQKESRLWLTTRFIHWQPQVPLAQFKFLSDLACALLWDSHWYLCFVWKFLIFQLSGSTKELIPLQLS